MIRKMQFVLVAAGLIVLLPIVLSVLQGVVRLAELTSSLLMDSVGLVD